MESEEKYCTYCGGPREKYYSPETLASVLDCSPRTVQGWIRKGSINSVKIHGLRRIPASEIERISERIYSVDAAMGWPLKMDDER